VSSAGTTGEVARGGGTVSGSQDDLESDSSAALAEDLREVGSSSQLGDVAASSGVRSFAAGGSSDTSGVGCSSGQQQQANSTSQEEEEEEGADMLDIEAGEEDMEEGEISGEEEEGDGGDIAEEDELNDDQDLDAVAAEAEVSTVFCRRRFGFFQCFGSVRSVSFRAASRDRIRILPSSSKNSKKIIDFFSFLTSL
jgi:hypothetical protein